MNFKEYQELAKTTAIYPESAKIFYPCLGLAGEVGEICEKVKKHVRDGRTLDTEDLKKELGDVLWYLSAVASDLGINLEDVATTNYEKLKSRQERTVIKGSGDNR
jgi:NTP pyrophosphatase (non-canonical NTP hydrolase)